MTQRNRDAARLFHDDNPPERLKRQMAAATLQGITVERCREVLGLAFGDGDWSLHAYDVASVREEDDVLKRAERGELFPIGEHEAVNGPLWIGEEES